MISEIGVAAGEIWALLDEESHQSVSLLIKKLACEEDLALMAIGWLCREGHVIIFKKNNERFLELRKKSE